MLLQIPRCNCPDATNRQSANPASRYASKLVDSDWSEGFNGIRQNGGYCIHELAVLRQRKEIDLAFPDGIPTDIPAPIPELFANQRVYNIPEIPLIPPIIQQ